MSSRPLERGVPRHRVGSDPWHSRAWRRSAALAWSAPEPASRHRLAALLTLELALLGGAACTSPRSDLSSLAERPAVPASVLLTGGAFLDPPSVQGMEPGDPLARTFGELSSEAEAMSLEEVASAMVEARVFVRLEVDSSDASGSHRRSLAGRRGNLPLQESEIAELLVRAREGGHDYVLILHRLQDGPVEEFGINDRWPLTLTTWLLVGLGFLVPDHTFGSGATLRCALFEVYTGREVHRSVGSPGTVDLSLLDRTDGWGLLSSILIPPFWVGNDEVRVAEEVRVAARRRLVTALARDLKSEGCRQDLGERSPASFAIRPLEAGRVAIEIRARSGIRLVAVRADGRPIEDATQRLFESQLLASERMEAGSFVYEGELPREVGGRLLQFLAQSVSGDAASATFDRRDGSASTR